ncbi:MAG: carbohydrate-binding family 9-like protein [Bacteroidota bacterium]
MLAFNKTFIILTIISFSIPKLLCSEYNILETLYTDSTKKEYIYYVHRLAGSMEINANWQKAQWETIKSVKLENYMGCLPDHFPKTEVKLCYDDEYIYVIFRVEDQYVRGVATETHGKVWEDSCVEFFFTPHTDVKQGYFNLEMNSKGIFLFQYHNRKIKKQGFIDLTDCRRIETSFSLKKDVREELQDPVTWTVEYRLPFNILEKYMEVDKPVTGTHWRANFYKCADKTSHPHWLTWAPVDYPEPKFHLPGFFGLIEFK